MHKIRKKIVIKLRLISRVYLFCVESEVLVCDRASCITEPEFNDQSAVCILKSKNAKLSLPKDFSEKINFLDKVERLRVFRDQQKNYKLILNLNY